MNLYYKHLIKLMVDWRSWKGFFCRLIIFVVGFFPVLGCSPKFYLVDRQTVLEDEAAGGWPDFEALVYEISKKHSVTDFPNVPLNARKAMLYHTPNGEWTGLIRETP